MTRWLYATFLLSCVAGHAVTAAGQPATGLRVAEPAFYDPETVADESTPAHPRLRLTRNMPTPGWRFEIDALEIDEAARRVTVEVSEVRPEGLVAQMIAPTVLEIPLETLERGNWFVEIRLRRGPEATHVPVYGLRVLAS
jgi:hypothetical protein